MSESYPEWDVSPQKPKAHARSAAMPTSSLSAQLRSYDELTFSPLAEFWTAQPAHPSNRLMSVYQDPVTREVWVHAPCPDLRPYVESRTGRPVTWVVYEDPALVCTEWTLHAKLVCTADIKAAVEARGFKVFSTVEQLWGPENKKSDYDMLDCRMCHKIKPRTSFRATVQKTGIRKCLDCEREYDRLALGRWAVDREDTRKTASTTTTTPTAATAVTTAAKKPSAVRPATPIKKTKTPSVAVAAAAEDKDHDDLQTRWGTSETEETDLSEDGDDGTVHVVASMDFPFSAADCDDESDDNGILPPMIISSPADSRGAAHIETSPVKPLISLSDQQKVEVKTPCLACEQLANQEKEQKRIQEKRRRTSVDDAILEQFEKFVISTSPEMQRKNQVATQAEQDPKLPVLPHTCKAHGIAATPTVEQKRAGSPEKTFRKSASPTKTRPKSFSPVQKTSSPHRPSPKKDPMPQEHQFEFLECNDCDRELPREQFSGRQRKMLDGRRRCLECTRVYEIGGQIGHADPEIVKTVATTGKVVTPEGIVLPFNQPLFKTWKNPGEETVSGTKVKAHKRAAEYIRNNVRAKVGTGGWDAVDEEEEDETHWAGDVPWLTWQRSKQRNGPTNMIVGEDEFTVARRNTGVALAYRPKTTDSAAYFVLATAEGAAVVTGASDLPRETIEREQRSVRVLVSARGAFAVQ
ncbi:hypothetical protein HDU86_004936 [Geranomyces michiganensis]|nr:hypothetical protein HDU86_004936 [Geranomyces michiganensis]